MHDGFAGQRARVELANMANSAGAALDYSSADLEDMASAMNEGKAPSMIEYKMDGKFARILNRSWE
jgi:hypothetical protein